MLEHFFEDTPVSGNVLSGTTSVDGPVTVTKFTIGGTDYTAGTTATMLRDLRDWRSACRNRVLAIPVSSASR